MSSDSMSENSFPGSSNSLRNRRWRKRSLYERFGKRAIDVAVSAFVLVVTLPVNACIAIRTYFDVGSPILFKQERVGIHGEVFTLVKFRNMTNETDENGQLLLPEDRVTDFGRFVRSTSLDELLNFWSIFKGDMSLIGPRPLLVEYRDLWTEEHLERLGVLPGLECPTPKRIDHAITWQEQFDNDVWYAANISLKTDIKLLVRLFSLVLDKEQRKAREDGTKGYFIGYRDGEAITEAEVDNWRSSRVFFPGRNLSEDK
ncbi:sugar transferase [Paraeggerthella hongkongensis]|uniref:Sugar transferase n=2 Tax=Paraeggerthella hongkongensis TaxID=230658 RepID=A0A3N0BE34_9ACTN|nr:sugar transferase [Paraeggerthella hongkongensis]